MIDTDLSQFLGCNTLAWLKEIYLKSDFDLLGEGALGEHGLHLRHHRARHHSSLRPNRVHFLADARHYRKVLREVVGDKPTDASATQIVVQLNQI